MSDSKPEGYEMETMVEGSHAYKSAVVAFGLLVLTVLIASP